MYVLTVHSHDRRLAYRDQSPSAQPQWQRLLMWLNRRQLADRFPAWRPSNNQR